MIPYFKHVNVHIFIIRLKSLAVGYDAAVFGKDESAEGIIFALGEFSPESMGNIIKKRGTRYFPGVVIDLDDVLVCFGRIILIVCSRRSFMVIIPDTPPYSSSTTAILRLPCCMFLKRMSALTPSGTK